MEQAREEGDPERQTPWDNKAASASGLPSLVLPGFSALHGCKSSDHVCVQFMEVHKNLNQNTILKCWATAQNLLSTQYKLAIIIQ